jgi:hypothetical protein
LRFALRWFEPGVIGKPVHGLLTVRQFEQPVYVAADAECDIDTTNGTISVRTIISRFITQDSSQAILWLIDENPLAVMKS